MLVLSRKIGEKIQIGEHIVVTIVKVKGGNTVRVGVEAPPETLVLRGELVGRESAATPHEITQENEHGIS